MECAAPLPILIINVSGCFIISFLNFVSDPAGEFYLGPRSRLFLVGRLHVGGTEFRINKLDRFVNFFCHHVDLVHRIINK